MADRPPGDGDDLWTSVIEQVTDALNDSDIDLGITRDVLVDSVREALEALGDGIDVQFDVVTATDDAVAEPPVDVSVVAGGRSDSDPPTPGDKPDLRVADPVGPDDVAADEGGDLNTAEPRVVTQVKVLRTPPRLSSSRRVPDSVPGLANAGWISVASGGEADAAWQTVYQSRDSRVYRLACTQGILDVTLDGEQIERLRPGQSIDVEGCLIRVSTPDGSEGKGGYTQVLPLVLAEE